MTAPNWGKLHDKTRWKKSLSLRLLSWATRRKSGSLSKAKNETEKPHNPSLSLISLLHDCLITTLPLLQAHGIMTRNDLRAARRFSSCSGRALRRFSNHLSSFWSFIYTHVRKRAVFTLCVWGFFGGAREQMRARASRATKASPITFDSVELRRSEPGVWARGEHVGTANAWEKCECWWIKAVTSHYCQVVV